MKFKKVLLVVDLQNDFCPGGALGVPGGERIIPAINKYIKFFSAKKLPVFVTRDWHPVNSRHFRDFGGLWPVHCIRNTNGAAFHRELKLSTNAVLFYKGMDPLRDSYSAFQAEDGKGVSLFRVLNSYGIKELFIAGLATDYCVKFTALDAIKRGFKVKILTDAIGGVDLKPGDSERALQQIFKKGAKKVTLDKLIKQ